MHDASASGPVYTCDQASARGYDQCWWLVLRQGETVTWVPFLVDGSVRHISPWLVFLSTNSPLVLEWNHVSFEDRLQVHRLTLLPLVAPWALAHLPLWTSSPCWYFQPWARSELWHDQTMTGVPLRELLPLSSRHLPPAPLISATCVVGRGGGGDVDGVGVADDGVEAGVQSSSTRNDPLVVVKVVPPSG